MDKKQGYIPFLLLGLISIVLGIVVIAYPSESTNAIAIIIGVTTIVLGLLALIGGIVNKLTFNIVAGILVLILGIVIVASPGKFYEWLGVIVGVAFIVSGALGLAKLPKGASEKTLTVVLNVLFIILGVLLVIGRWAFQQSVAILIGIFLLIYGISYLIIAFSVRKRLQ